MLHFFQVYCFMGKLVKEYPFRRVFFLLLKCCSSDVAYKYYSMKLSTDECLDPAKHTIVQLHFLKAKY